MNIRQCFLELRLKMSGMLFETHCISTITAFNCEIYYMKFICLVVLRHTVHEIGLILIFYNTFLPFWKVPLYCEALSPYLHVRHGRRHRRRSGWNYGGRMASAEGGSVPSGVRYGEDREDDPQSWAPQQGAGESPGRKQILAYFEGHRTLLFLPIWQNLRAQFAL